MTTLVPNSMLEEYTAKPCFRATLGGTNAVVAADVTVVIPFDTPAINVGSYFDADAHTFTPPAGIYRLGVRGAQLDATSGSELMRVSIFKNGVAIARQEYPGTGIGVVIPFSLTTLVEADGDDVFDARYFSFTLAGTKTLSGDVLYTAFEGEQV